MRGVTAVLVVLFLSLSTGVGVAGCGSALGFSSRSGPTLPFGDRGERRFVPRITQRSPTFYTIDPQGDVVHEPTPQADEDTWWLMIRGQW